MWAFIEDIEMQKFFRSWLASALVEQANIHEARMRRDDDQMVASRTQSYWKSGAQRQVTKESNAALGKSLQII